MTELPSAPDDRPTHEAPPAGELLEGRYVLEQPISRGAMGAVWAAQDRHGGERVAVKRLLDIRQAARFEIEARLLSYLDHPRVVRVRQHFVDSGAHYLVMDLVVGKDLAALLRQRGRPGLDPPEAIRHAREACEALHYVHEHQVVHRDVKPANLIGSDGGVVLVDFGIARELAPGEAATTGVGTPGFMAPEVIGGGRVSARSDVFGAAATLWTLLAGRPPPYGEGASLPEVVPEVEPELVAALAAALETSPERRTPTVAAFAESLGQPLTGHDGRPLISTVPRPRAPRRLLEAIVRTAAGVFGAAATSIALADPDSRELVYEAAWGAGADEIVGARLGRGEGIAGTALEKGRPIAVAHCREDPRFAVQVANRTGHVPHTMLAIPLLRAGRALGVLAILDRRDGHPYGPEDISKGELFADLAVNALATEVTPGES